MTNVVPREAKAAHDQKIINAYHHKLLIAETAIRQGLTGQPLQRMEKMKLFYETRLMSLYATGKYGLVQ